MQIFLTKAESEFVPNEFIKVKFDGNNLRTYLNGTLVDERPATSGECFYIQPNVSKKKPTVSKAVLPETRGKRIAWALSFVGDKKWANSYEEFFLLCTNIRGVTVEQDISFILGKGEKYGLALLNTEKALPKPLLAYISDDISKQELITLLKNFKSYRKIFCPEEFFDFL